MSDLTYWLVRHADGERYLYNDHIEPRWMDRLRACPFKSLEAARRDRDRTHEWHPDEERGTVVRVTVKRVPRRTLVERLDAALGATEEQIREWEGSQ